jgi:uncharacterized protein (DUF3084 family)
MEHASLSLAQMFVLVGGVIGTISASCGLAWLFFNGRFAILKEQVEASEKKVKAIEIELIEIRAERNTLRSELELHRTMRLETLEELREAHKTIERLQARLNYYEQRKSDAP